MPAPIELALSTLIPTVSFLPSDLIFLANSLLAQSKTKARSLKQEEEIGRVYVCAHIACERAKKRLELEIGKPVPPMKPRVYDKLYKYLDSVLTTPTGGLRTSKTNRVRDFVGNVSGKKKEEVKTPESGKRGREEEKTPTSTKRPREEEREKEVPDFVMPMIRTICKATGMTAAAPHVLVGAGAVAKEIMSRNQPREHPPSRKRRRITPGSAKSTKSESENAAAGSLAMARWSALLLALHCLTATKMKGLEDGDAEVKTIRKTGISAVKAFCSEKAETLPEGVDSKLRSLDADIGFYLLEAEDCGWLEMDWCKNIPVGHDDEDEVMEDDEEEEDAVTPKRTKRPHKTPLQRKEKHGGKVADPLEGDLGPAGLLPGLGTMFSFAVDWLSDERRAEYAQWKKGVLEEIATVEQKA